MSSKKINFFSENRKNADNSYMDISPLQIWTRLKSEAKRTNIALNQAAVATGISSGTISDWKRSYPTVDNLATVVNFYHSSLDFVVFGKNNMAISAEEENLLTNFRLLDSRDKEDIIDNINGKIERSKKGDILSNAENA